MPDAVWSEPYRGNTANETGVFSATKLFDGTTPASAASGLVSIGAGAWNGVTAGFFAGSASGTLLALNAPSGFAGNLIDAQIAGVSKFTVGSAGVVLPAATPLAWSTDVFLHRDAAAVLALRNSTNAQAFRIYNTYTNSTNYELCLMGWGTNIFYLQTFSTGTGVGRAMWVGTGNATALTLGTSAADRWQVAANGNFLAQGLFNLAVGNAALATNATIGFLMVNSCAGPATGTPASIPTGQIPLVYDSTNNKLYAYSGSWRSTAALA